MRSSFDGLCPLRREETLLLSPKLSPLLPSFLFLKDRFLPSLVSNRDGQKLFKLAVPVTESSLVTADFGPCRMSA